MQPDGMHPSNGKAAGRHLGLLGGEDEDEEDEDEENGEGRSKGQEEWKRLWLSQT